MTDLQSIHLILPAKLDLFIITETATPKTLSTYNVTTITKKKPNVDLDRFSEHRRPVEKQTNSSKPTTASERFLRNNHNATEI